MEGKIKCKKQNLHLLMTFNCGQCYRWRLIDENKWLGVYDQRVWILEQQDDCLLFKVYENERRSNLILNDGSPTFFEDLLWDYFRLYENLEEHYKRWSDCDVHFKNAAEKFYGLRMLKQDPAEILFTFICSSNNTITRITSMVESLCKLFGDTILVAGSVYYGFPHVSKLASPIIEQQLRAAKFGFRAKYIWQAAQKIMDLGGDSWFTKLKMLSHSDAKIEMMKLPGIGEKVADCICLMSLEHLNAIPVDTHVFQISQRYLPHLKEHKTATKQMYKEIGDHFRSMFGHFAGWAHVVLFCSDLRMHQENKNEIQNPVLAKKRKKVVK